MSDRFFSYELPPDRIAQYSLGRSGPRSASRLLHGRWQPAGGSGEFCIYDRSFSDLPGILQTGDLLVLNNSAVWPCRFFASLEGSDTPLELLLLRKFQDAALTPDEVGYESLARPMKRAKVGKEIRLSRRLLARVLGRTASETELRLAVRCETGASETVGSVEAAILADGLVPIPGYIRGGKADEQDRRDYQTVYAETPGSVAAPTAGFHFTPELFRDLNARGVESAFVTLHVGPASFQPVQDIAQHEMPSESYAIPVQTLQRIAETKARGGRIVAVGTTTLRALESFAQVGSANAAGEFHQTQLFIKPGFAFQTADLLLTNFHQPRTTHLLLVAAFIGEAAAEKVYQHALQARYRFLSYGDACLFERDRGNDR